MTRLTLVEIRARYAFARWLHTVRYSPNALGSMRSIAKRTALHASVLRRFARVAEGVLPSDLEDFTNLRTPRGLPLTWSHLEELATMRVEIGFDPDIYKIVRSFIEKHRSAVRLIPPEATREPEYVDYEPELAHPA